MKESEKCKSSNENLYAFSTTTPEEYIYLNIVSLDNVMRKKKLLIKFKKYDSRVKKDAIWFKRIE